MRLGGIVLAAGKSSRMGMFKPLLPFKESTVIENTILSFINAGVVNVCVVTGRNAEDVESVIKKYNVKITRNTNYENTDMITSIKLGLQMMIDTDAILILPGDVPSIDSNTIVKLIEQFMNSEVAVLYPSVNGKKGHPPIIRKICYQDILTYVGNGGLREVLDLYKDSSGFFCTNDVGCLIDLDYKEDYEKLLKRDC